MKFFDWIRQRFCRHDTVAIKRWHPSTLLPQNVNKVAWYDTLGVANLLRCEKCGKWLTPVRHERLHGERPEQ